MTIKCTPKDLYQIIKNKWQELGKPHHLIADADLINFLYYLQTEYGPADVKHLTREISSFYEICRDRDRPNCQKDAARESCLRLFKSFSESRTQGDRLDFLLSRCYTQ